MKRASKLIIFVLSVVAAMCMLIFSASAETSSGQCGENVTWTYDNVAQTLTISGTGDMYDYTESSLPEYIGYSFRYTEVIVESGVTSIGSYAFDNDLNSYRTIEKVSLPDTIKTINDHAFRYCTHLTSINIPDSVESIGDHAFIQCSRLENIKLSERLTEIGAHTFSSCSNMTNITIPESVDSVGTFAFYNSGLKQIAFKNANCSFGEGSYVDAGISKATTIYGFKGSTAEAYAAKKSRTFVAFTEISDYESAVSYVRSCILNKSEDFFAIYSGNVADIMSDKFLDDVLSHDKSLSNTGDALRWNIKNITTVPGSVVEFIVSYYTTKENEEELSAAVQEIIGSLPLDGKSDYEKVRIIFEYMTDNISSVEELYSSEIHHSAYSALVNKEAVCQGFATAFYQLALEAGVDCRVVINAAPEIDHMWNIVEIDGKWYYIDTFLAVDDDISDDSFYFLKKAISVLSDGSDVEVFPVFRTAENVKDINVTPFASDYYLISDTDYIAEGGCGHILEEIGLNGYPCAEDAAMIYRCKACGFEFRRAYIADHTDENGDFICDVCSVNFCPHKNLDTTPAVDPTCVDEGFGGKIVCADCKEVLFSGDTIPPTGRHIDNDGNGTCDICGKKTGGNTDKPTDDDSGNAITRFFKSVFAWFNKVSKAIRNIFGKKK